MAITRRRFIKGVATAASVAYIGRPAFGQEKKIRFAQVGCGGQGRAHHGMWRAGECVAACDTDRRALQGISGENTRKYTDFRKVFEYHADSIDAVIVATPDHIHYPAAMTALKLGKAVFCEKPLTLTLTEADDLVATVGDKKIPFCVAHTYLGHWTSRLARHIVKSGLLGTIRWVDSRYIQGWLAGRTEDQGVIHKKPAYSIHSPPPNAVCPRNVKGIS